MFSDATKLEIQKLFETSEPPDLGPGPRPGIKPEAELYKSLDRLFAGANAQGEQLELVRALLLLWHDHLDAAHKIAQDVGSASGSFVHGIMHRREPDYGNAAYWFRRVGKHPAFGEIAPRVTKALGAKGDGELARKLTRGGEWDAFAFISACEGAARSSDGDGTKEALRKVQAIETAALFDWLCST